MINNYDRIAKYYDFLSRLVFGKSQVKAQINQLKYITPKSRLLIVGGGTGWILEEIAKRHQSGLKITYVEISSKMITLSKARKCGDNDVVFVHSGVEEFNADEYFDVIMTPFLFDNFSPERCSQVFQKLNLTIKDGGLWLMVDFVTQSTNGKWWQQFFLKTMYTFFSVISNVEAKKLVDMNPYFQKHEYQIIEQRFYYGHFITAMVYKK